MPKSLSRKIKRIVLVDYSNRPKQRAHLRKYKSGKRKLINQGIKKRQRMSLGVPKRERVVPSKYHGSGRRQISESEAESIKKNIELAREFETEPHLTSGQKAYAKRMGLMDEDRDESFSFQRSRDKFRETSD